MNISKKMFKKAPLPWRVVIEQHNLPKVNHSNSLDWDYIKNHKILDIIRKALKKKYGERINLNTKEIKDWGEFLSERKIYWEIIVSQKKNWIDWECVSDDEGRIIMKPKNLENHMKVFYYYVPFDLSTKMLVLGELL